MAEGARLESVYTATYRGFESLPHRHIQRKSLYASTGFFVLYRAAPGGMRSLDPGSTTGAASGTVCEPCELTARRVRPSGPNQSLPHRHIQRKSLYESTGFFVLYRDDPGGMRSLDTGSTTGAASGTVCEPCELTARRVRPSGPNQSLPHRHIQRKSLYASTGFFVLYRARKTAGALRLPALQYLPQMFCRVGKRKRTHQPRARNLS